jgi:hypothetical protein
VAEDVRRRRPYRGRFVFVYGALVAAVGAGIAGLVLVLAGGGTQRHVGAEPAREAWSTWVPTSASADARLREIAEHVGRAYRLPNGDQLLDVSARRPFINVRPSAGSKPVPTPVKYVVVNTPDGKAGSPTALERDESELYSLCGLGSSCTVALGKTSNERQRLIRRESLELALFTFKYVEDVKYVIAVLPPAEQSAPANALYFNRSDLDDQLRVPLAETLSEKTPVSATAPREIAVIDRLTQPHMFSLRLLRDPQNELIFGLTPLGS